MNVDPELRKRVEQIKSSPVQLYREAGDYSNRELVEGILVSPDDIAAIEVAARSEGRSAGYRDGLLDEVDIPRIRAALHAAQIGCKPNIPHCRATHWGHAIRIAAAYKEARRPDVDPAEAAHHRMVQPDHYQRWER